MKTAFVILHYQNADVTNRCIRCLQALNKIEEHEIIVVDNGSPNGSGEMLRETYAAASNVHVLLTGENLGFARGNNKGYAYARERGAQIIVVMNSDVYIYDKEFIAHAQEAFASTGADIIAPEIYAPVYKIYQNPYATEVVTREWAEKRLEKLRERDQKINRPILGDCIIIYKHIFERLYDFRKRTISRDPKRQYGTVPHGSCVIYGGEWVKNEDFAFVPITFFYGEEKILGYYAQQKKYTSCYVPELYVEHEAGASRNITYSRLTAQRKFYTKQEIAAVEALLKLMEEMEEPC